MVAGDDPGVAKLRILLVTPTARCIGIGPDWWSNDIAFARDAGYRRVTLWTIDVLVRGARNLRGFFGFTLTEQELHHSFGHDLIGQNWTLDL